jgi:hypothetical protein
MMALNLATTQAQLASVTAEAEKSRLALMEERASAAVRDSFIAQLQSMVAASSSHS